MSWDYILPVEPEKPTPPSRPADTLPLGTKATNTDGQEWFVVWDNQDKRHIWHYTDEDV